MTTHLSSYTKGKRLTILAQPNSSTNQIVGWDESRQALKVRIKAPPEDGKANKELCSYLKKEFQARSCTLISGGNSRKKIIEINL